MNTLSVNNFLGGNLVISRNFRPFINSITAGSFAVNYEGTPPSTSGFMFLQVTSGFGSQRALGFYPGPNATTTGLPHETITRLDFTIANCFESSVNFGVSYNIGSEIPDTSVVTGGSTLVFPQISGGSTFLDTYVEIWSYVFSAPSGKEAFIAVIPLGVSPTQSAVFRPMIVYWATKRYCCNFHLWTF